MDGLIVPDLPFEEQEELMTVLNASEDTILIQLVSPVSGARIPKILAGRGDSSTVYRPWVSRDRERSSTRR